MFLDTLIFYRNILNQKTSNESKFLFIIFLLTIVITIVLQYYNMFLFFLNNDLFWMEINSEFLLSVFIGFLLLCNRLLQIQGLKQYPMLVHSSVGQKSGQAWLGSLPRFLQGQNQDVGQAHNLNTLGQSIYKLNRIIGRIQFLAVVGLKSLC